MHRGDATVRMVWTPGHDTKTQFLMQVTIASGGVDGDHHDNSCYRDARPSIAVMFSCEAERGAMRALHHGSFT
jgi:hypothetical protein